jgi:glycosyltransferase involved in cell wall biosynthesis
MEAMHFGLPLILSDVGSARDVIVDSDIGLVIPNPYDDILALDCSGINELAYNDRPRNLDNLIAAMKEMIMSPEAWKAKGQKGVRKIAEEFTVVRMVQAYEREIFGTCRAHAD